MILRKDASRGQFDALILKLQLHPKCQTDIQILTQLNCFQEICVKCDNCKK